MSCSAGRGRAVVELARHQFEDAELAVMGLRETMRQEATDRRFLAAG
jgi:hypothetical protein